MKQVLLFGLSILLMNIAYSQNQINISANGEGEKFEHFWSKCVGAGRANEGLRAGWLEQLQKVQENCGFETVRFHGLFHDDMFPVFKIDGKTVYNWQYIDDLFDRMLALNVRPFIELSFFPKSLAAENSKTQFWWKANITPDESKFGEWHDLVKAFTQHCVDRYGIDEVMLSDLKPGTMFKIEVLNKEHGNIYDYWEAMGKPEPPTREQVKMMKKVAENLKTVTAIADENGKLHIQQELSPWSVVLIEQIN